jgi:hypothetical protein
MADLNAPLRGKRVLFRDKSDVCLPYKAGFVPTHIEIAGWSTRVATEFRHCAPTDDTITVYAILGARLVAAPPRRADGRRPQTGGQ